MIIVTAAGGLRLSSLKLNTLNVMQTSGSASDQSEGTSQTPDCSNVSKHGLRVSRGAVAPRVLGDHRAHGQRRGRRRRPRARLARREEAGRDGGGAAADDGQVQETGERSFPGIISNCYIVCFYLRRSSSQVYKCPMFFVGNEWTFWSAVQALVSH